MQKKVLFYFFSFLFISFHFFSFLFISFHLYSFLFLSFPFFSFFPFLFLSFFLSFFSDFRFALSGPNPLGGGSSSSLGSKKDPYSSKGTIKGKEGRKLMIRRFVFTLKKKKKKKT